MSISRIDSRICLALREFAVSQFDGKFRLALPSTIIIEELYECRWEVYVCCSYPFPVHSHTRQILKTETENKIKITYFCGFYFERVREPRGSPTRSARPTATFRKAFQDQGPANNNNNNNSTWQIDIWSKPRQAEPSKWCVKGAPSVCINFEIHGICFWVPGTRQPP